MVVVAFQITFRAEMHANDFFLKKLFLTSAHQNDPKDTKHIKFQQNFFLNFLGTRFAPRSHWFLNIIIND